MSDDLAALLGELHGIVNNFTITGEGVSGNLTEGYMVEFEPPWTAPSDVPEGPEGPESSSQT